MSRKAAGGAAPCRIAIEGELTIYNAADWKGRLYEPIARGDSLELDLSAVQELDTAGLQVLIMAKKEALARGQALHLCNHSQAVQDALELCGLAAFFGDPILLRPNAP